MESELKEDPRTQDEYVGKRVMGREVRGSGRRGRPKKRWADCVKDDPREKTVRRGGVRPSCMEATWVPHRPHIEVG